MKTSKKIIVTSLVLAVMASSPLNSNVNAKPNSINLKIKSGWVQENENWYYYNDSNVMVKNKWIGDYYLGKDGVMLVNTTTPDGYRVDRKGKWINGEWITNSTGKWFKYYNGGYPYSRWLEIDAQWYYFDSSGYAVKNQWVGNYYLGKDSVMLVNTTTPDGYKVDKNGKLIDEGEIIKEYDVIRFKYKNGKFAINKWVKVNSDWYYFDGSSKAKVLAWVGDYYLDEDGKMLKSTVTPDGYTVDENGKWDGNRAIKLKKELIEISYNINDLSSSEFSDKKVSVPNTNTNTNILVLTKDDLKNNDREKINRFIEDVKNNYNKLLNNYRSANGLDKLTVQDDLSTGTKIRSDEMLRTGVYSHQRPDGSSHYTAFIGTSGENYSIGENIYTMYFWQLQGKTAEELAEYIFNNFKKSTGHNKNMLRDYYTDTYTEISIGGNKAGYLNNGEPCAYIVTSLAYRR